MISFHKAYALITSIPEVESESPFIMSFNAKLGGQGKDVPVKFIGHAARALRMHFRNGDRVLLSGFMKGENLLVEYCMFDAKDSIGRQLSYYA